MRPGIESLWARILWRFLWLLAAAVAVGLVIGQVAVTVLVVVLVCGGWQAWQLFRFSRWFCEGGTSLPEELDSSGLWGRLYGQVLGLRLRARHRKRRLSEYLRRSRELAAALPDGVIALAVDNTIEWFNRAAADIFALKSHDVGQRVDNILRYPDFIAYLRREDFEREAPLMLPERPGQVFAVRQIPYGEGLRLIIVRDVSESTRLEAMRRDFVANASHELRTPLTVLAGYIEVLGERFHEDPVIVRVLDQMQDQSQRMRLLIDDLLMISRLEEPAVEGRSERVDMRALMARLFNEGESLAQGQRLDLGTVSDVDLLGDEKTLYSAFSNLLNNALQYTPAGGLVRLEWLRAGDSGHFVVSDTGCGIPQQHLPRLTERFYRVDAGRSSTLGGTGLGLSIVKHVLRRHDAYLDIDSTVGQGSRFRCCFPPQRLCHGHAGGRRA